MIALTSAVGNCLREMRHNPWLMRPLTALLMIFIIILWIVSSILAIPTIILGAIARPFSSRMIWAVEFLYPLRIGRWGHLLIAKHIEQSRKTADHDVCKGSHSRTIETRIEIIKDRIYVHPLPQLLDNLGYLVVCLPTTNAGYQSHVPISEIDNKSCESSSIVSFVVDCGDADSVTKQVSMISEFHYQNLQIQVQSILSTHKHHDHTAGNYGLLTNRTSVIDIRNIFGGAVEGVPHCNYPITNGDFLPLPKCAENNMNDVIEVEAIATPGHTRGSITYVLRPRNLRYGVGTVCIFTGDTVFSGGSGVPFEADIDQNIDSKIKKMSGHSFIKASASIYAVERCFSEILFRSVSWKELKDISNAQLLIFPGHEYTNELLARQIVSPDRFKLNSASPDVFFETVSRYYVASQRRSLPQNSGKLLCVPSPVRTEILINPNLRSLKARGEMLVFAIKSWNRNWAKNKTAESISGAYGVNNENECPGKVVIRTPSSETQWNLNHDVLNKPVYTTVYSSELDAIISDLRSNKVNGASAAVRLSNLKSSLSKPVVLRRPIPGTLPTSKNIYKGLVAFVLLGSAPTGMTLSDSCTMKLQPPVTTSSDCIRISKRHLIAVLLRLGLLDADRAGNLIVSIIHNLWKEAFELEKDLKAVRLSERSLQVPKNDTDYGGVEVVKSGAVTDNESATSAEAGDEATLGSLKWLIYGIPEQRLSAFSYCLPCSKTDDGISSAHPAGQSSWKIHSGELVRHDLLSCKVSRSATGYVSSHPDTLDDNERLQNMIVEPEIEDCSLFENEIDLESSRFIMSEY